MTKLTTTTTTIAFTLLTAAVVFLYGSDSNARGLNNDHYPNCSPVAHEVQGSWRRGEITRAEAEQIIDSCLAWEDKQ